MWTNIALILSSLPSLFAQADRFGLPTCSGEGRELVDHRFFVLCHDAARRVPSWTAYEIHPAQLGGEAARPRHFHRDAALSAPGARDADYRQSGYSRGHMAPAEDMAWSDDAIRATFVLSNVAPQRQDVNAGPWRRLESAVRVAAASADVTYVFTGPIFAAESTERIGEGQVAVPSHFFKVVLTIVGNSMTMYAAIMPNEKTNGETLAKFATTVDEVERQTGLDFFPALDAREQRRLESERNLYSVTETGKNSAISMIGRPPENTR